MSRAKATKSAGAAAAATLRRAPVQLISLDDNGEFAVCEAGAHFLSSIAGPVSLVSVVGCVFPCLRYWAPPRAVGRELLI